MRIAISGASGFVGAHLSAYLRHRGHEVVSLGRADLVAGAEERLVQLIAPCDAVVNLAGAPINHRWSPQYKEELWASRVDTTHRLVEAVNHNPGVGTFISTSAVGIYPAAGCCDEIDGARGYSFLAGLCARWEEEARKVQTRCVITRFGVVLAPDGGAFPVLSRSARMRIATIAGHGRHALSWIALEDLLRAEEFLLTHPDVVGVFNLTAPQRLTMRDFIHAVAHHYGAWLTIPIPAMAIRLVLGEAADIALEGQCAVPRRLLDAGFGFETPTVDDFLQRL